MRRATGVALVLFVAAGSASAQQAAQPAPATQPAQAARPSVTPQPTASAAERDSLAAAVEFLRHAIRGPLLPALGEVTRGDRTIDAGTRVKGPVSVVRGSLDVFGQIDGDAAVYDGRIVLHPGSSVTGNIFALRGSVNADSGDVGGEIRILRREALAAAPAPKVVLSPAQATKRALEITFGAFAMMLLIGIGVFVFAGKHLEGVVDELEERFGKSFWAGLVGQVALVPVLLLLCLALALTVIGVLLIPFAVVAFILAAIGLATLGFLAASQMTGYSIFRAKDRPLTQRGLALRALLAGVSVYLVVWAVAAALTWAPPAVTITLRGIAFVLTWAAATAGFGAALLSRAGTLGEKEISAAPAPKRAVPDELSWQTPTPVSGVVAARRPTPLAVPREH